ncbi:MAG: FkbM family methyltransferase [Planctomycetota bacterium]
MKQLLRSAARGIFYRSGLANYFKGQKAQDKWVILNVLPFKRRGFFLDLAAADGVEGSNSYVLEKLFGWRGICIEPNPGYFDALRKTRRCIADPSVISDRCETIQFRIDNGQLGGIVASDTDNNAEIRGDQLSSAKILDLKAVPLIDVLRRHNAPKVIDYFSLDVEGCEERIIGSFDFDQYTFRCLTIERPTPKVNEVLFANGYLFVKNDRFDSFYVHSSLAERKHIERQPFEQVPKKTW